MGIDIFGHGLELLDDTLSVSQTYVDDIALKFGTGGTVSIIYETADANANALLFVAPEGGATDVPAFIFGDASILNSDLGWFNGVTEPTLVVVNDAKDAYIGIDAGDDAVAASKGLYFKAAADEDVELLNLSVTGTPRIYWDESEDQFRSTKGWVFDAACDVQGTWVATAAWTLPSVTLGGDILHAAAIETQSTVDTSYVVTRGGIGQTGAYFSVSGKSRSGGQGQMEFGTTKADATATERLLISGNSDTATATWTSCAQVFGAQYLQLTEMTAPGAGAADTARMYAVVGGDSLTDLAAVFQDGTVAIFAQEVTPLDAPTFTYPSGTEVKVILRKEHPGLVKIVSVFPNGKEFVLQEIQYHNPEKIAANKGAEQPLPLDWLIEGGKDGNNSLSI